jgi:Arc/MetJ-type ribon-helix-helix transcriptional regulator
LGENAASQLLILSLVMQYTSQYQGAAITTTVKLPAELETSLRERCASEGRNISEVMRNALAAYLSKPIARANSAASLGADLFGRYSGSPILASSRRSAMASFGQKSLLIAQRAGDAPRGPSA